LPFIATRWTRKHVTQMLVHVCFGMKPKRGFSGVHVARMCGVSPILYIVPGLCESRWPCLGYPCARSCIGATLERLQTFTDHMPSVWVVRVVAALRSEFTLDEGEARRDAPVVVLTADQGLFSTYTLCAYGYHLRIVYFADPNHQESNVDKGLLAAAGYAQVVSFYLLWATPWGGHIRTKPRSASIMKISVPKAALFLESRPQRPPTPVGPEPSRGRGSGQSPELISCQMGIP
jgi:hypothetical protein